MVQVIARQRAAIRNAAQRQLTVLAAASLLLLVCGAFAAHTVFRSMDRLVQATDLAREQSDVTVAIQSTLRDAEAGQRGFLLTGRPAYLEPYEHGLATLEPLLAHLAALARASSWLKPDADRLAPLAHAMMATLQQTIALANANDRPGAIAIVESDAGRGIMNAVRTLTTRIVERSEVDRAVQSSSLEHDEHVLTGLLLTGLGGGVALLTGVLALLIVNRMRLLQARTGERREFDRLNATVENVPDGIAVFDNEDNLAVVNARFATIMGIDPALSARGTPFTALAAAATTDPPVLQAGRPAEAVTVEAKAQARSLEIWRSPLPDGGQLVAVADTTRRVAAEEAARQSQRMDVLGQMTGGVAHDFNNLLQIISANLELLRNRLVRMPGTEPLLARLDAASGGVARGTRLTRYLLAFARRQPLAPEPIDSTRQLQGLEEMLRRTVGEGVTLKIVIGGSLWFMRADPGQFENALLNLALNARDAMTASDGAAKGCLTIEAANIALDEAYATRAAEVSPGQYVMFAVTDTGSGMTAEQRARAVEPFYTTKPEGRGTGLGLPMVLGFAKQSGGHFELCSTPGEGTTARLYIPRTTAPARIADAPAASPPMGAGQLVLIVEDDPAVRQVAREALLALDYKVMEAETADAGLALIEGGLRPGLLFTDVVMPGRRTARQMVERARTLIPGLGVLFTSGYTQNGIVHDGQLDTDVALISKPWRQDELAHALRSAHAGPPTRPAPRRRVLLVEAEDLVRATTADALAELGFEVVEVKTAAAALGHLKPRPDLLLTDFGLPDQNGLHLIGAMRQQIPGLPAILSSGPGTPPEDGLIRLQKPYDVQDLRRAIQTAFDGPPPA